MSSHARPTRIVLVGDEGNAIRRTLDALRSVHYTLYFVRELQQALLLSPRHAFDVLFLNISDNGSSAEYLARQAREALPLLPIVMIVGDLDEFEQERLYRAGAWKVWSHNRLTAETIEQTLSNLSGEAAARREHRIRELLEGLKTDPVMFDVSFQDDNREPLRKTLPLKFLELTRSYGNVLELVLARSGVRRHLSGHSVSHKLRYLAADLALLNAGPRDVLDIHTEALAAHGRRQAEDCETRRLLIDLLTILVAQYKEKASANTEA
ncbi:MAG TPA: response regulator [Bacteroidota bacterium]|nr:response regulator [Bacteroidota bacterium]